MGAPGRPRYHAAMPLVPLGSLPDDARVWVFAAERALSTAEAEAVLGTVDAFLGVWAAHGHPLRSARELRESRFLIIAVDEAAAGASGCSIDALVREIRALEAQLGVTLVDHGPITRHFERVTQLVRDGGDQLIARECRADLHPEVPLIAGDARQQNPSGHVRRQSERRFDVHDDVGRVNIGDQLREGARPPHAIVNQLADPRRGGPDPSRFRCEQARGDC